MLQDVGGDERQQYVPRTYVRSTVPHVLPLPCTGRRLDSTASTLLAYVKRYNRTTGSQVPVVLYCSSSGTGGTWVRQSLRTGTTVVPVQRSYLVWRTVRDTIRSKSKSTAGSAVLCIGNSRQPCKT